MLIWHPFQKLWNHNLLSYLKNSIPNRFILGKIRKGVILTDTFLLLLRVVKRNFMREKDFTNLSKMDSISINYFDIGTHKRGYEIEFLIESLFKKYSFNYKIYAFEASTSMAQEAKKALKKHKNVQVANLALCNNVPKSKVVKLYKSDGGLGNSFFTNDNSESEEVPADSLSNFIKENRIELSSSINILRMNIEGAELGVLQDLVKNNLLKYFNGLYGMWDDLEKLDKKESESAKIFLKKNNITPFTFNGRDLKFSFRKKVILKELNSAIRVGVLGSKLK